MKTYATKAGDIEHRWHVIDASGKTLGRLASQIAILLMGKHKPMYTPNLDTGDYVIVLNAAKVKVTGNKAKQKIYYRHTGYPGGRKVTRMIELLDKHPDRILRKAVRGMLPKNRLARKQISKLKIYTGNEHPHEAQEPKNLEINVSREVR